MIITKTISRKFTFNILFLIFFIKVKVILFNIIFESYNIIICKIIIYIIKILRKKIIILFFKKVDGYKNNFLNSGVLYNLFNV